MATIMVRFTDEEERMLQELARQAGTTPEELVNQAHWRDLASRVAQKQWTVKQVERCVWNGTAAYK